MRACVESVLVLSLMNKLRPLLEEEQLLSAFTKVSCSLLYSSFAKDPASSDQKVDSDICWNRYPADNTIGFPKSFTMCRDFSAG